MNLKRLLNISTFKIAALLVFCLLASTAFSETTKYKVKIVDENQAVVEGVQIFGNHDFQQSFSDTDGEAVFDLRDLDRKGSSEALYLHFAKPGYKLEPAEIEVNPNNCPKRTCKVLAIPSTNEESAVVRLYFVNSMNRPVPGVKANLSAAYSFCGKATDGYGAVYFSTTRKQNCNDGDGDISNDTNKVMLLPALGMQCAFSNLVSAVCPKQVFTSQANVISCSYLPNRAVSGYTIRARSKNDLALLNLNLRVIPQNSNFNSFNVNTDASGTVTIPFNQIGTGNYPLARIIPIGRHHFFPAEIYASSENCPKGICQLHAGEAALSQKIQSVLFKSADNKPVTGVSAEVAANGICRSNAGLFSDKEGKVTFPVRESSGCSLQEHYTMLPRLNGCEFTYNNQALPFSLCPKDINIPEIIATCNQADSEHEISGYVFDPYGQPLESVAILKNGHIAAQTRANGSYSISVNNGENIALRALFEPLLFDPRSINITGVNRDKIQNFNALTAEGGMPENGGGDSCDVADNYSVSGTVFDLNGQRLANVSILNNHEQVSISDENGNYQFAIEAYEDVWVTAEYDDQLFNPAGYAFPVIACDKPQTNFHITLIPSYIQAGFVRDQDNNPIKEFELGVIADGVNSQVITDSTGYYRAVFEEDTNFTIEPQDSRYGNCSPASRSEISDSDRYNLDFTCQIDKCPESDKLDPGVCGCNTPDIDSDGDGTMDCIDQCPSEASKVLPGACGCGFPDIDSDGDGVLDCEDACPFDADKTEAGICGCGIADVDSDGDGVLDCNDECPNDSAKTKPESCGCGELETDSDNDGTPNCVDFCPQDPEKIAPLFCGCGELETDSDLDGTPDCVDLCPLDPDKIEPGECGCGVSDADSDSDGIKDCKELCPEDPLKTKPGECGCGVVDKDTDGDGVLDCKEECPNDANKLLPGECGCGVPDVDTDNDKTLDCFDECPLDSKKIAPGQCGCGVSDVDTDEDGVADCNDLCPQDPLKTEPGQCGCGMEDVDSDGDGVADCKDECPEDPDKSKAGLCGCGVSDQDSDNDEVLDCQDDCPFDAEKTEPGLCGCGVSDQDTDGDGVIDCKENCIFDPEKTEPGVCGCGIPDIDTDGDGVLNCKDACPLDSNKTTDQGLCGCGVADTDTDGDGTPDCQDQCPNDPLKMEVGQCGCGVADTDTDRDGVADCNDGCPTDPNKTDPGICGCGVSDKDSDGDGTPDCQDLCKDDPAKIAPGVCGCGNSDVDSDGDGVADCNDGCPQDTLKLAAGACGCGVPDTDSDKDGTPDCNDKCPQDPFKTEPGECGCGYQDFDLNGNGIADCNEKPMTVAPECKEKGDAPEKEITICHTDEDTGHKHEITVAMSALAQHLDHGDSFGPCEDDGGNPPNNPPNDQKIEICHYPPGNKKNAHTIKISQSAWSAHSGHGDTLGPCAGDFSTTASIRWKIQNRNSISYDANIEILASSPEQVTHFIIPKNSSQVITTRQIDGYNVAVLRSGYMVHAATIHDLQDCPALKSPVTITPLCKDTIVEQGQEQEIKWKIKNIAGQKLEGIVGILDASPAQYQKLILNAGQETIVTTKQISGVNKLALYVNGVERAISTHNLGICPNPNVIIGGSIKGMNGRPINARVRKMLEGQKIWIELRDTKTKNKQIINFSEEFTWQAVVPQGTRIRAVLKNSGNLSVKSVPRVFRETVRASSKGYHFAVGKVTRFTTRKMHRSSNAN